MQKFLVVALLLCGLVVSASAQSEFIRETDNYKMGIGPILGYKMGINAADVPEGIKNGVGAATMPDFGAQFYMPLDPDNKMGLIIDAIYANYPYTIKTESQQNQSVEMLEHFEYVGIGANFYLNGFTVGLNLGIPMGGNTSIDGEEVGEYESPIMNTMFEFRVGGNFTLNESNTGRFVLFINLGYQVNGQFTDEMNLGSYNRHPASIQLGLGYLLNMGGE